MASALQCFTYGEFTMTDKGGKYTLKTAEALESFGNFSSSYDKLCASARLAKAAMRIFAEPAENMQAAFDLLYTTYSFMAYSDTTADDAYIYFLLHSFKLSGQCPAIETCAVCGKALFSEPVLRFSAEHGGAVCSVCIARDADFVSPLALEALRRMATIPYNEMGKIKLTKPLQNELFKLLDKYYKFWY